MNPPPPSEALLIPDRECARLSGCGRTHWLSLYAAGKTPPSIKLGRKRLWRRKEIVDWIEAGCPDGQVWAALQAAAGRRLKVS